MATSTIPSALSFPPATFAKLSPAPYLLAHLDPTSSSASPTRPSGRSPQQCRSPTVNTGSLTHANGSAVVRLGDSAVVCGVRAEVLRTSDVPHPYRGPKDSKREIEELGLLVPNIELSTGCSPGFLPGNAPGTLAQSLTQRLLSLLHLSKLVNVEDLKVKYQPPETEDDLPDAPPELQTKAYWVLYIDLLVISLDGNPFDAAWGAILAALSDTKLPKAWWDADREAVLCSDQLSDAKSLTLGNIPASLTFAVFTTATPQKKPEDAKNWVLADPDGFEEELCNESITVVATEKSILRIEKRGGGFVGREAMRELVSHTQSRLGDWKQALNQEQR
jgi:exosome complex component RRP43